MQGSLMSATERAEGLAEGLQQEREQSAALHSGLTREQARTHDLQARPRSHSFRCAAPCVCTLCLRKCYSREYCQRS